MIAMELSGVHIKSYVSITKVMVNTVTGTTLDTVEGYLSDIQHTFGGDVYVALKKNLGRPEDIGNYFRVMYDGEVTILDDNDTRRSRK